IREKDIGRKSRLSRLGRSAAGPPPSPHRQPHLPLLLPRHLVSHPDLAAFEHLGAGSASPVGAQGGLEAGSGFVHALAGRALGEDLEAAGTDAEDAAARPLQADAREEEIGAAGGGVEAWVPQIGKSVGPGLFLQEDHLAAAPLVGVAHQALAGLQGGGLGRVHGASLESLQPDGADLSGTAGPHFTGAGEVKTASASCAGAEMSPSSSFLSSPTWLRCGASMM